MNGSLSAERRRKTILSVVLAFICILYILPVLAVVVNSFKLNTYVKTETFALPTAESFAGWANYIKGVTFGNYPFWKSAFYSLFITLVSTALILAVHLDGRVVHRPRGQQALPRRLLPLRLFHGRAVPDGHVHPLQDRRPREDPIL